MDDADWLDSIANDVHPINDDLLFSAAATSQQGDIKVEYNDDSNFEVGHESRYL